MELELNGSKFVGEDAQYKMQSILGVPNVSADRLASDFLGTALLEQDLVRAFLAVSTSGERYELLSRLLGMDIVNGFVEILSKTESTLADRVKKAEVDLEETKGVFDTAQDQLNELAIRIETSPVLTETTLKLKTKLNEIGLGSIIPPDMIQRDAEFLQRDIRQYGQLLSSLSELSDEIEIHSSQKPSFVLQELQDLASKVKDKLDSQRSEVNVKKKREKEAKEKLEDATTKAGSVKQVASLAMGLLTNRCPVCDQQIDPHSVRSRLESLIAEQPGFSDAKIIYEQIHDDYQAISKSVSDLEDRYVSIRSDIGIVESWDQQFTLLARRLDKSSKRFINCNFPVPVPKNNLICDWLPTLKDWLSTFAEKLGTAEELAGQLVAAQSVVEEKKRYDRLYRELAHFKKRCCEAEGELEEARKVRQNRKRLCMNTREAAARVIDDAFIELGPVAQDLFARLAPHPTFNLLSLSHDVYYRKGSTMPYAEDEQTKLKINPAIGFSSAQANVAALCYFVALAFANSEADFGFILLDDPLQSMDDLNVLGFSDLCRFLRREKQLIISTHEERLGNLLTRKLTARDEPLQTLRLNFSCWDRSGPNIELERISTLHTEPVLATLV